MLKVLSKLLWLKYSVHSSSLYVDFIAPLYALERDRRASDRKVVGFTTTGTISAYNH